MSNSDRYDINMFTAEDDPIILPDSFADAPETEQPSHMFPPARQPEDDPSYAGSSLTFTRSLIPGPPRSPVSFPLPELPPMRDTEWPAFMLENHVETNDHTAPGIEEGAMGGETYNVTLNPRIARDLDWSANNSYSASGRPRQIWRPAAKVTVNDIDMTLAHGYAQNYVMGEGEPTDTGAVVCTSTAREYQLCNHHVQGAVHRKPHCWRCALAQLSTEYLTTGSNGNCEPEIAEITGDCPVCKVDVIPRAERYDQAIKLLQDREEASKTRSAKHEERISGKADNEFAVPATAPTTPARDHKRRASSGWWNSQPRKNGRFVKKEDADE